MSDIDDFLSSNPSQGPSTGSDIDAFLGVKPEAKRVDKGRSWAQVAGDTGIDLAKGVVGLGESTVGLADLATVNLAGRGLAAVGYDPARTQQALGDLYSDPRQQANRQVSEAKGFVDTTKALLQNPSAIAGGVVESAPMMLGSVGAVRTVALKMLASAGLVAGTAEAAAFLANPMVAAKLTAIGSAAEGAMTAGNIQEQGRQAGRDYTDTAPAALAGGALTAAIGFGTSKIPGFRDAEVGMATAGMGGVQRQGLLATGKEIAKGTFKEGVLEEMPQSAQEQVFTNLALSKPWAEGVPEAAAQGMVVGAAQGGGMNVYSAGRNAMGEVAANPAIPAEIKASDESNVNQPIAPVENAQTAINSIAKEPDSNTAEKTLLTPVTLTALDRVNELDTELAPVHQRLTELTSDGSGDPAFDQERLDLTAQAAALEQERISLSKDWPKSVTGIPSSFTTEAGARVEAQYALMDAADLITSHDEGLRKNPLYPPELQPRERDRAASEMQVSGIVQKLDPARLGLSADAANGAPIVGADGLVESGNARTIALKRVYQAGGQKSEDYKQFLRTNASQFGITPEAVDGMAKPVLVRVRSTPVNRAEFARQANASTVAAMAPSEQAKSDSSRIDSMEDLAPDDSGDFSNAASRPFVRRFMARLPITEQAGMIDANGDLSTTGYARVRNAVLAKAYGDSPVLARMTESMDDNLRNVSKAMMMAAPKVAQMREAVSAGNRFDADITPDLMAAVEELSRLKDDGGSVQDALAQTDLMGDQRTPEASQLLQFLSDNMRRPRRMADFISAYMDALDAAGDPNQGSLLGDTQSPTKQDLLKAAERATTNDNETPNPGTTTQEATPRTGSQTGQKPGDAPGSGRSAEGHGADTGAASHGSAGQTSQPVSGDWVEFPPESGAMGIPRAKMPQVQADKRPALYDFLMAKGITHTRSFVKPGALKPTQAEYSPAKAENAKALDGQKAVVLASSDGYILDGHHRWVSRAALGDMVDVIKFSAPMGKLLEAVREFPGATTSSESAQAPVTPEAATPHEPSAARAEYVALAKEALGELAAIASKHTRMTMLPEDTPGLMPALVKLFSAAIKIAGSDMKAATKWVKAQLKADPRLKSFWQLISNETYQKAALQAFENPVAPDQSEMFEKPVAGEDQSSLFGETSGAVERPPEASNTADISEEKQPLALAEQGQAAIKTVANPAKEQELAAQEPAAVTPVKPAKIEDIGEKIGGARKDTAGATGPRLATAKAQDDRPTWANRFQISQIAKGFDISVQGRDITGKWTISDTRNKDRYDQPKQMGSYFDSKEDAEAALPLLALAQKHRVTSTAKGADGEYRYEIWRDISDRKRVKVVDKVFDTRTEAMAYMAKNAQAILETSTTFGEADLPKPESTSRLGVERRTGDVKGEDFQAAFGFRGVEFGNWNNQDERQEVMNAAYDGLMDLAEVLGVPPKAIGLNGDLALAFGARGQGLSSARAHYERNRAVMNLTKMNGAGALAHEWFHALDHYLGRQDGKASAEWKINPDGTRSFDVKGAEGDMASGGFRMRNSGVREELRGAYAKLVQSLFYKAEQYVDDTAKADKFVAAARGDLEKELAALRKDLSEQKDVRYYKRSNKPASAEQLAEFDALAAEFVEGRGLATEWKSFPGKTRMSIQSRHTNDALEKMSEIYKAVRGRSGFDATNHNGVMDTLRQYITRYEQRLKLLADANSETSKTKNVPTNFAMDAKSMDQGRGTDYWTTPHEMVARAFQGYVEDMIAARGGKSPFLNYAPENSGVLTPWGVKRPYPSGDERKAMNAEFDNFVGAIQTKETEQGVAMFSRTQSDFKFAPGAAPIESSVLDGVISRITAKWKGNGQASVVRVSTFDMLPARILQAAKDQGYDNASASERIPGVTWNGKVYLVQENITSEALAEQTLLHERVHQVLRGNAGDAGSVNLRRTLVRLYQGMGEGPGMVAIAAQAGLKMSGIAKQAANLPTATRGLLATEELLADIEGSRAFEGLPAKVLRLLREFHGQLRAWMRGNGFSKMADALGEDLSAVTLPDLNYILKGLRQAQAQAGDAAIRFSRVQVDGSASATVAGQTDTPAFKAWFGDSKVVDAEGKPLVMYHGTSASQGGEAFTSFDTYASSYGLMGMGGYFTADPAVASSYTTKGKGTTPTVYKVFLSIKTPLDMDAKADPAAWSKQFDGIAEYHDGGATNESWYRSAEESLSDQSIPKYEGAEIMQDGLRAMGFDGITHIGGGRVKSDGVKHRVYIIFESEQAKSATGNNGDFDESNPDIRMSRGEGGGMDVGVLETLAARIQARMPNMPKVNVLASPLDAPKALRDYIEEQGAMDDVDGAMHKGQLYLFASGLPNALRAEHVLAEHEAAHFGLRAILGDSLKGAMQAIYNNNATVRQAATELQRRGRLSNADATEEVIVDIPSSKLVKLTGWRKVVQHARRWLADHGFDAMAAKLSGWLDGTLTDQQRADLMVANLVHAARAYMAGKRGKRVKVRTETMLSGTEEGGSAVLSRSGAAGPPPIDPKDASPLQKAKAKALSLTSPQALDQLMYDFTDKYIDLKRIRDHIKSIGGTITDLNDAYLGEELYHKRLSKRVEDFLSDEVQPLLADLRARGVGAEAFEQFLHARHAPEANKSMAARNPTQAEIDAGKASAEAVVKALEVQLQGAVARGAATAAIEKSLALAREEGYKWVGAQAFKGTEEERLSLSGMTDAQAQAVMAGLTPTQLKNMEALAARVDAIKAKTMDALGQYGLMDQESLGEWRKAYQFYIPLHRDEAHPDSTSHPIGQGFSVKGDAAKRRTGSNAKVTNILGHVAMQREAALTRGEKNTVVKKLYVMAAQNPDAELWSVEGVPTITTVDKKSGFAHTYPDPMYKNKPNVVMVRIAGKDAAIVFNERNQQGVRLAGAMKNIDVGDLGAILTQTARVTRWFAAVNTQYNPVFGLVNFARDIQAAMLNLSTTPLAGQQAKVAKGVPSALRAVYRVERGKTPSSAEGAKWAALWEDLQEVGGTTGYRDMYSDASDRMTALLKDLQKLDRGQVRQAAHAVVDWLSDYNDAIENGVRLSAYSAALDQGMSRERAASLAKNLTVNFNRKGAKAREIGALYAFFNAAIQGNARMFETLRGPVGKKIMFGGVALGMITSMLGMAVMGGGDGEDDEWEGIPEFVKERAIVIPLGHQDYMAIPLPLGFHVFPNLGRLMAAWAMGGPDKSPGKQVGKVLGSLVDSFNPVGGGSDIGQVVMPTVMDPLLALWRNKDWTGRPIYRDDSNSMDPTPGFTRAKDSASTPGKKFAELINWISGGNEYRPGAWSPTPDQLDYVVGQVTGGLGRELLKAEQVVTTPFTGDELPAYKVPVLGRIYGNTRGSGAQSGAFYENVRELNEVENEVKGRNKNDDEADAYMASEPLTNLIGDGNSQEKIVSNLRKQRKQELRDEEPGYKDRVKEINTQIEEEMRVLNRAVARVKSGAAVE